MNKGSSAAVNPSGEKKHTIFVTNLDDWVTEDQLLNVFVAFGDILDIQLPREQSRDGKPARHRGFAFLTYTSALDAQDAIDNYDLNAFPALPGHRPSSKVLKVNLARTMKNAPQMAGNGNRAIWANEEWLKEHALPLEQSGGLGEERPETKEKEEEEEVELEQ